MLTIGSKRKRLVPEADKAVSGDLTVSGALTVDGLATVNTLSVTSASHYGGVVHVGAGSRGVAFAERATVPAQTTNASGMYNDDGTNSDCGLAMMRMTVDGSTWIDSGPRTGTWTPLITDSSGNSYASQVVTDGNYVLFGPFVFLRFFVTYTGKGSAVATDIVRISGMPFSNPSNGRVYGQVQIGSLAVPTGAQPVVIDNASYMRFERFDDQANLLVSDTGTNGNFRGCLTYTTV